MILNQFQVWSRTAPTGRRADGVSALARAYLYSNLDEQQRSDAARVLTSFLDDPSVDVRRALAEALASAAEAPHHIVLALADDCSTVSKVVLSRSPVLSDAELIDCAAIAESDAQAAIASRPNLSAPVAAALAEVADVPAVISLIRNRDASLPTFIISRIVERHGEAAEVRQALLERDDLPASVRIDLVSATAQALATAMAGRNWVSSERMKRIACEAGEKAAVTIMANAVDHRRELVAHLRRSGRLTSSFAFRAILSGKIELFKAMIVELSGRSPARVDRLTRQCESAAFAVLYRACGLPLDLLPAFRIALAVARDADWSQVRDASFSRAAIERVLTACAAINHGDLDHLLVLLRRFEGEIAREEARSETIGDIPSQGSLSPRIVSDEPLLLTDLDADDDQATNWLGSVVPSRREPRVINVDLAALEAELCIA